MENVRRFVFAAASMALAALSCAGAGASVDFASASGMDWRVWAEGFEDAYVVAGCWIRSCLEREEFSGV